MSHRRRFYDAADPSSVPDHSLAAVYVNTDGSFAWPKKHVNRMRGVFGVSESGNASFARYARCVAVEPGAAEPSQVPGFLTARQGHGHHDGMCYVNLSNWAEVERVCLDHGLDPDWWVAHPGDGHPEELRSPIKHKHPIAVQTIWTNAYDISVILGDLKFTPPDQFHPTG